MFPLPTLSPVVSIVSSILRVSYYYLLAMYVRIMCSSNRIDLPSIIGRGRNQPEKTNYEKPMILVALEEMTVYREEDM